MKDDQWTKDVVDALRGCLGFEPLYAVKAVRTLVDRVQPINWRDVFNPIHMKSKREDN